MSQRATNIINHELIGLEVEVLKDSNSYNEGVKGVISDETMNTLVIENTIVKRIAKKDAVFKFLLHDKAVKVEGKVLLGRPENRVKKTVKSEW